MTRITDPSRIREAINSTNRLRYLLNFTYQIPTEQITEMIVDTDK